MTLNQFIDKWLGKKADYDGHYGGQCVDLYRFYVKEVLGYPQSPGVGGAAEIWDSADPKYYDFITNTPSGVPQRGDIVIWNRRVGGGFGHVAIFLNGDVNRFTSLDQNWPTLDKVTKTEHTYLSVIGWLRPKGGNPGNGDNMEIDPKVFEELVNKSTKWDNVAKLGYSSAAQIEQEVDEYKTDIQRKNDEIKAERERAESNRLDFNNLLATIAKALGTVQEINQVATAIKNMEADLDTLDDLKRQYAELQRISAETEEELQAEIKRLKLTNDAEQYLKTLDDLEFFKKFLKELIRRLQKLVER